MREGDAVARERAEREVNGPSKKKWETGRVRGRPRCGGKKAERPGPTERGTWAWGAEQHEVSGPKQAEPRERERGKLGCAGCYGLGPSAGERAAGRGEKGVGRAGV